LKDWKGYRAGLDVTSNILYNLRNRFNKKKFFLDGNTGTHSIYTEYLGHEIMFHVSTLLPFSTTNSQQVKNFTTLLDY